MMDTQCVHDKQSLLHYNVQVAERCEKELSFTCYSLMAASG